MHSLRMAHATATMVFKSMGGRSGCVLIQEGEGYQVAAPRALMPITSAVLLSHYNVRVTMRRTPLGIWDAGRQRALCV